MQPCVITFSVKTLALAFVAAPSLSFKVFTAVTGLSSESCDDDKLEDCFFTVLED